MNRRIIAIAAIALIFSIHAYASDQPSTEEKSKRQDFIQDGNRKVRIIDGADGTLEWSQPHKRSVLTFHLREFFGSAKGKYVNIYPEMARRMNADPESAYVQFMFAFEGAPYPEEKLSNGKRLLAASVPHDEATKAILVTDGNSAKIFAAALLHNFCGMKAPDATAPTKTACQDTPTLTIFYSGRSQKTSEINDELRTWVKEELAKSNSTLSGSSPSVIRAVNVEMRNLASK